MSNIFCQKKTKIAKKKFRITNKWEKLIGTFNLVSSGKPGGNLSGTWGEIWWKDEVNMKKTLGKT